MSENIVEKFKEIFKDYKEPKKKKKTRGFLTPRHSIGRIMMEK